MKRAGEGADEAQAWPHPREADVLIGHEEAERALLGAYRGGRLPHAWLIGGPAGIGKATLAYRMARFVLANADPASAAVQAASSLAVDPSHPVARQVAARAHSDLLVLERTLTDTGSLRSVITVDEVRRTVSFFGSTAGQGGWRVCVVDSADELQYPQASNALLKVLEEPPERSLFLLISHAPARILPTIQSRCRKLSLRPLTVENVVLAAAESSGRGKDDSTLIEVAKTSEGSVARALTLIGGGALDLHQQTLALLETLPHIDARALHALGDALGSNDRTTIAVFVDTIDRWIGERLKIADANANLPWLARLAEVWEKINRAARETESFNLERKPLVFSVFGLLADVTR